MPCHDERDDYDRSHNNEAAELLCSVLKSKTEEQIKELPLNVQSWWRDHQDRDAMYERKSRGLK